MLYTGTEPSTYNNLPDLILAEHEVAIFAYGSLLLPGSLEKTLGKTYDQQRYICGLQGFRRSWDIHMPNTAFYESTATGDFVPKNIIYLNITPSAADTVNGVLYILDSAELDVFDQREWIYRREPVETELTGVRVHGRAFAYVGLQAWLLDPAKSAREHAAIRQSYLCLVDDGIETLGPEFRAAYDRSTDPLPSNLVFADRRR